MSIGMVERVEELDKDVVAGDIAATWGGLVEAISVALFVGIVPEMDYRDVLLSWI